mmetsp:Transcript_76391/g.210977  ORF Transcript_76391/g.210977 Transcript_76391/m.210977 type:complete len:258 (+) Transcript_76391:103-876(+)
MGPSPCTSKNLPYTLSQGQASWIVLYVSRAGSQPFAKACWKGRQICCKGRSMEPSSAAMCSTKASTPPGLRARNTSRTTARGSSTEQSTLLHTARETLPLGTAATSWTKERIARLRRSSFPEVGPSMSPSASSSIGTAPESPRGPSASCVKDVKLESGSEALRTALAASVVSPGTAMPSCRACAVALAHVKLLGSTATISSGLGRSAPRMNRRSPPEPAPTSSTRVATPGAGRGTACATARSMFASSSETPPAPLSS